MMYLEDDDGNTDSGNQLPDDGTIEKPMKLPGRNVMSDNSDGSWANLINTDILRMLLIGIIFQLLLRYVMREFDTDRMEYKGALTHNLDLAVLYNNQELESDV